jgi:hypothetical protein
MRVVKKVFYALLLIGLLVGGNSVAQAGSLLFGTQQPYESIGGFIVQGEFLKFYRSARDPLLVFGYPISNEFINPATGLKTQSFLRARFDLVNTPSGPIVQPAPLGKSLYRPGFPEVNLAANNSICRIFIETGKRVCYAFLNFYDENNGRVFFGNPISNLELHDNRYVQYFERVRMEWRPDSAAVVHVALSDFGAIDYFDRDIYTPNVDSLPLRLPSPDSITSLQVRAFVSQPLLQAWGEQTLYIIVQDQDLLPVQGANVSVRVYYSGRPDPQPLTPYITSEHGISIQRFSIENLSPKEIVQVKIEASYQKLNASTSTWFRVWW